MEVVVVVLFVVLRGLFRVARVILVLRLGNAVITLVVYPWGLANRVGWLIILHSDFWSLRHLWKVLVTIVVLLASLNVGLGHNLGLERLVLLLSG